MAGHLHPLFRCKILRSKKDPAANGGVFLMTELSIFRAVGFYAPAGENGGASRNARRGKRNFVFIGVPKFFRKLK